MSSIARTVAVGVALVVGAGSGVGVCPAAAAAQIVSVVRSPGTTQRPPVVAAPVDTSSAPVRHPTTQLTDLTAWVDSAVIVYRGTADSVEVKPTPAPKHADSVRHVAPTHHRTPVRPSSNNIAIGPYHASSLKGPVELRGAGIVQ